MSNVVIFGGFVVDISGHTEKLPVRGQSVIGHSLALLPGGKGFNQGVACHLSGANTHMVTKLGKDVFAGYAKRFAATVGMDTTFFFESEKEATGCALIGVEDGSAMNQILILPGASEWFNSEEIAAMSSQLKAGDYFLTQLEPDVTCVLEAIHAAKSRGAVIILNPAPAKSLPFEAFEQTDVITPNETEAEMYTGIRISDEQSMSDSCDFFLKKGVKNVVITLGERGVYWADKNVRELIPPFHVKAVDTVGAGDAFNGGLTAALAMGKSFRNAIVFASAVAALSVQKPGAAISIPCREETDAFLKEHGYSV